MRRRAVLVGAALLVALLAWWLVRDGDAPAASAPMASGARTTRPDLDEHPAAEPQPLTPAVPGPDATAAAGPPPLPKARPAPQVLDGVLDLDEDGVHVRGRVVDAAGRPVAGARILLVEDSWGVEGQYFESDVDRATTDVEGRFRLRRETWRDVDSLRLVVDAEGWPPWFGRVEPVGDGGDIVLGDVDWLPLRVVFEDGGPVANALVQYENPAFERTGHKDGSMSEETSIGRTGADGRLTLPVFASRRELSIVLLHELHAGRYEVPLAAWREGGRDFVWTLTVPRGAACELQLTGWPGGWPGKAPWVGLLLRPYERLDDGSLALVDEVDWEPDTQPLAAGIVDGLAHLSHLDAPAYRVELSQYGGNEVLADPWTPTPGLTTWTHATPPVPSAWKEPLVVEVALQGDEGAGAWSHLEWTLVATDGQGHIEEHRLAGPGTATFSGNLKEPVTLSLPDIGAAGVRTGVPPSGAYRFELDAAAVLEATGGVRADLSALEPSAATDEARLVFWPAPGRNGRIIDALEGHGLPPGRYPIRIEAPGVDDHTQSVLIEAGRTAVVHALPAAQPIDGLLRGRVRVRGDDSWMRVTRVRLEGSAPDSSPGIDDLGRLSFSTRLQAGHYRGRVTLGRLPAPEAFASSHDPGLIPLSRFDDLPGAGTFECDVRASQTTDVVVDMDATGLCLLRVTAPSEAEARRTGKPGPATWFFSLLHPGAEEEQSKGFVGLWSDEGITVLAPPGTWRIAAERWPNTPPEFVRLLEADFEVSEGLATLDVALQPPAPAPAESPAR